VGSALFQRLSTLRCNYFGAPIKHGQEWKANALFLFFGRQGGFAFFQKLLGIRGRNVDHHCDVLVVQKLTNLVQATTIGGVYTGLAIASNASGDFLYAANDAGTGSIDVFNGTWALQSPSDFPFVDPTLPTGYVPFNVQNLQVNGTTYLYVTYAPAGRTNQILATEGQGYVAVFDTNGNFIRELVSGSKLASPWGITLAPATFGKFGGDLLVANFAYNANEINAFDPATACTAAPSSTPMATRCCTPAARPCGRSTSAMAATAATATRSTSPPASWARLTGHHGRDSRPVRLPPAGYAAAHPHSHRDQPEHYQ
jgi:uncharacterized protein (TIGR03118 family)